jgi:hypothetical protein
LKEKRINQLKRQYQKERLTPPTPDDPKQELMNKLPSDISSESKNGDRDLVNADSEDDEDLLFDMAQKWAESEQKRGGKISTKDDGLHPRKEKLIASRNKSKHTKDEKTSPETKINTGSLHESESKQRITNGTSIHQKNEFSLHITNLPYNATKSEMMQVFLDKGCRVTSARMVFNYHTSRSRRDNDKKNGGFQNSNGFTGVAFVDFADKKSYMLGLDMDKMIWGQTPEQKPEQQYGRGWKRRRINIRPTKTKEELAQIVAQTKEKLAAQKQDHHNINGKQKAFNKEKNIGHVQFCDDKEKNSKKRNVEKNDNGSSASKHKRRKTETRTITKQNRAKRAAILRSKQVE